LFIAKTRANEDQFWKTQSQMPTVAWYIYIYINEVLSARFQAYGTNYTLIYGLFNHMLIFFILKQRTIVILIFFFY